MAFNFKKIWEGLKIVKKAASTSDSVGDLEVLSSDNKLRYHNGTSNSPIVTEAHSATLTNKTFDANGTGNSISNIETADLASGVLVQSTDIPLSPGITAASTDFQIPSAKAVYKALDGQNQASEISFSPTTDIPDTNVQDAVEQVQANLQTHLNNTTAAHAASSISNSPSGNLIATTVQGALDELQTDVDTRATSSALSSHTGATSAHGVSGSIVGTSDSQVLTNKTIDADLNTISNIENADIKAGAAIDASKIANGSVSNAEFQTLDGVTSSIQTQLTGKVDKSTLTAKGSLISATASSTPVDVPVGINGYVLTADSTQASGLKWAASSGGGVVGIPAPTSFTLLSGQSTPVDVTGLSYSTTTDLGFVIEYTIYASGTPADYPVIGRFRGIYNTTGNFWQTSTDYAGQDGGFSLTITPAGQVQYTSGVRGGTLNYIKLITYAK